MAIPEFIKNKNIFDFAQEVIVYPDKCDEEDIQKLIDLGADVEYDEDGEVEYAEPIYMYLPDVDELGIDYKCWEYGDFDQYYFDEILDGIFPNADIYLVFNSHATWDGRGGYMKADNKRDIVYREYDSSFYPIDSKFDDKVVFAKESSHDVPMGGAVTVLSLTDQEYDAMTHEYDEEIDDVWEIDPDPELVNKFIEQGHLDEEDFERTYYQY